VVFGVGVGVGVGVAGVGVGFGVGVAIGGGGGEEVAAAASGFFLSIAYDEIKNPILPARMHSVAAPAMIHPRVCRVRYVTCPRPCVLVGDGGQLTGVRCAGDSGTGVCGAGVDNPPPAATGRPWIA